MYVRELYTPVYRMSILSMLSTAQNYLLLVTDIFLRLSISLKSTLYPSVYQYFNIV